MPKPADEDPSLRDYKQNLADVLDLLHQSDIPMMLAGNGVPEVVVPDADAHKRMLETIESQTSVEGIRENLADAKTGRKLPFGEALRAFMNPRRR
jgi:PHD/YefM family antitoxin component YafN of YafNO toxin-antitoxin module